MECFHNNGAKPVANPPTNYLLGIAQMNRYAHYHQNGEILSEVRDREGYFGWGFGKVPLRFSDQKFGWNGDDIGKVAFEIDVTDAAIGADDESHVRGAQ